MTVTATSRVKSYTTSGTRGPFAVPFQFFEIAVYLDGSRVADTDYVITQDSPGSTGDVTFNVAPTGTIVIKGETAKIQDTDYVENDSFPAETHERALDRLTMIAQEIDVAINGVLRISAPGATIPPLELVGSGDNLIVTRQDGGLKVATPSRSGFAYVDTTGALTVRDTAPGGNVSSIVRAALVGPDTPVTDLVALPVSLDIPVVDVNKAYVDDADDALSVRIAVIEGNTLSSVIHADGSVAFTAPIAAQSPINPEHVATKSYVDSTAVGIDVKSPVKAKTTTNVANYATGAPSIVDDVTLSVGDRVLVSNQSSPQTNGIFIVTVVGTGSNGTWVRASDADVWSKLPRAYVLVQGGTSWSGSAWYSTVSVNGTLGTTPITWQQFSGVGFNTSYSRIGL